MVKLLKAFILKSSLKLLKLLKLGIKNQKKNITNISINTGIALFLGKNMSKCLRSKEVAK